VVGSESEKDSEDTSRVNTSETLILDHRMNANRQRRSLSLTLMSSAPHSYLLAKLVRTSDALIDAGLWSSVLSIVR
jgi:hypothetical protein